MTDHEVSRTSDGLIVKRYRPNAGDLPDREWRALRLLHEYAPGLAPEPVAADLDATPPSVTMSVLPGESLGGQPLSPAEMGAIRNALDRMHTCVPQDVIVAVPDGFAPRQTLGSVTNQLTAQPRPSEDPVVARAYDDSLCWLAGSEAYGLLGDEPEPVFARSDHNLSNFLWDGDRVRLVDFEYAGRSDRCAEMAQLVEHISARCTPDRAWQGFVDDLELSRAEYQRLRTIRRLFAMSWLHMLMPGQAGDSRNPPGTLRMQAERTLGLLG